MSDTKPLKVVKPVDAALLSTLLEIRKAHILLKEGKRVASKMLEHSKEQLKDSEQNGSSNNNASP